MRSSTAGWGGRRLGARPLPRDSPRKACQRVGIVERLELHRVEFAQEQQRLAAGKSLDPRQQHRDNRNAFLDALADEAPELEALPRAQPRGPDEDGGRFHLTNGELQYILEPAARWHLLR